MMKELEQFKSAWREFAQSIGPGHDRLLMMPGDAAILENLPHRHHRNWGEVVGDEQFGTADDRRLQLRLVPQPFMGDLEKAKVVVLLLNPGLTPADFHAEFEHVEFRDQLIRNLKFERADDRYPFLFLDPAWSWTSGYSWCYSRLRRVIERVGEKVGRECEPRAHVAKHLAFLELIPYHSKTGPLGVSALESSRLAGELVRAFNDEGRPMVVARAEGEWKLPSGDHVFVPKSSRGVSFPLAKEGEQPKAGDFIVKALCTG